MRFVWKWLTRERVFLGAAVAASLLLNTVALGSIPAGFHGDEAEQALQAQAILEGKESLLGFGWYGLPIASFLPQSLGLILFGQTIFGARITSVLFGSLTLIPFFFLAKQLFDSRTAIFSTILLATSHWWIAFSRLGANYIPVALFAVLSYFLLLFGLNQNNKRVLFLTGLTLGISPYLYFAARLTPFITLFALVIFAAQEKPQTFKLVRLISILLLGFIITVLPIAYSMWRSPKLAFSRQNDVFIFGEGLGARWRERTYGETGWLQVFLGQAKRSLSLTDSWADTSGQYGYRGRILDLPTLFLFSLGAIGIFWSLSKVMSLFPLIWFFLTLFTGWILTENPPFSPRVIGAIPALYLIVGQGASTLFGFLEKKRKPKRALIVLVLILGVIIGQNLFTYFVRGTKEEWGDPNKYTATKVALYLNELGKDYQSIFLTAPFFFSDFGPIRFLSPEARREDVLKPELYQSRLVRLTVFVIHPKYKDLLEKIKIVNPLGRVIEERRRDGGLQVFYYQVD